MNWLEVTVVVDAETAEAVSEVMSRYAPNAVAVERRAADSPPDTPWSPDGPLEPVAYVRAYLPVNPEIGSNRRKLEEGLWHLRQIVPMPDPAFRELQPSDWENAWKEYFHVVRLGERIVIRPSWRTYAPRPGEVVIELDPGLAFGTGLHPTTKMCLRALERYMPAGARVIDVGTGSGILAIAAAKLGATAVTAIDIDPTAVAAARNNMRRNRVARRVRVEQGTLADGQLRPYDFAVVNILAGTIIELCEAGLARALKPEGRAMLAGLIDTQESEVREALERAELTVMDRMTEDDWVGLVCRRRAGSY